MITDLKLAGQKCYEIPPFFGKTPEEQIIVDNVLALYSSTIRQKLDLPILDYHKMYNFPLPF